MNLLKGHRYFFQSIKNFKNPNIKSLLVKLIVENKNSLFLTYILIKNAYDKYYRVLEGRPQSELY